MTLGCAKNKGTPHCRRFGGVKPCAEHGRTRNAVKLVCEENGHSKISPAILHFVGPGRSSSSAGSCSRRPPHRAVDSGDKTMRRAWPYGERCKARTRIERTQQEEGRMHACSPSPFRFAPDPHRGCNRCRGTSRGCGSPCRSDPPSARPVGTGNSEPGDHHGNSYGLAACRSA